MRQSIDWVAEAVQSLHTAASRADELGAGEVFSSWGALADQIRLVASGLDPAGIPGERRPWPSVREGLTAALEALDRVGPPDGPDDLRLWQWHLREVSDLAARLETPR
jgi:hypothetical protein